MRFIASLMGSGFKSMSPDDIDALLDRQPVEHVRRAVDAYAVVPWVRRCVDLRAGALASVPYEILDKNGQPVAFVPLRHLLYKTERWLCLAGAAYWLIRGTRRLPLLQVLNPLTMRVDSDALSGVVGFEQTVGGRSTLFSRDEVVYISLFNPASDVGPGVPPAATALASARLAHNAMEWSAAYFERSAIPAVILTTDLPLSRDEREEIRGIWDRMVAGIKRAWRTVVLGGGVKPVIVGSPVRDVGMPQLLASVRQQIAVAFGVPQTLLEDAANFATARQHWISFWRETVMPEAMIIAEELNAQLFGKFGLLFRWRFSEVEAFQQDEAEKAASVVALVQAGIMTLDEARRQMGLEEMKPAVAETKSVGNTVMAHAVVADLEKWRRKARRALREEDAQEALAFKSAVLPRQLVSVICQRIADRDEDAFSFLQNLRVGAEVKVEPDRKYEAGLRRRVQSVLSHRLDAIIAAPQTVDAALQALAGLDDELRSVLEPALARIAVDVALAEAITVGLYPDVAAINVAALEWAGQYSYELVKGLTDTTRTAVRNAITQFIATPGMTVGDLRSMLEPSFGAVRSEMIAITEVTRAAAHGTEIYQQLVKDWGVEMDRVWQTSHDGDVCPVCKTNHDKREWEWTEPDGPPAHPRCRCWTTLRVKK